MQCPGECADLQTDNANCGQCDRICSGGKTCVTGNCACTGTNILECSGACIDKTTNNSHCGMCDMACNGGKTCQGGSCQCTGGMVSCSQPLRQRLLGLQHIAALQQRLLGGAGSQHSDAVG
jgi:hypothetical protein